MRAFLSLLFLLVGMAQAPAQPIPDLSAYSTVPSRLKALAAMCDSLNNLEKYDQLYAVADYALRITPANDHYHLSIFNYQKGIVREYQKSVQDKDLFYYHEKGLLHARKAQSPVRVRESLIRLLFMYTNVAGHGKQSDAALKEVLGIIDTTRSQQDKVALYSTVGNYYAMKGAYDTQIKYLLESIAIKKKLIASGQIKDRENVVASLMNLAELYIELNQPEKGLAYSKEARAYIISNKTYLSHHYKDMTDVYLSMKNVKMAKIYYDSVAYMIDQADKLERSRNNKIAVDLGFTDYYLTQNQVDSAYIYIRRANELAEAWAGEFLMSQVKYMTGEVYLAKKEYQKALPLLIASEPLCADSGPQVYADLLKSLAKCYGATGQWKRAADYYEKYIPLRDSLYVEASKKSFADAEALYQNKEKQQQIEIKNIQISEAKKQRLWLVGGLFMATLSLLLLGVIYRNKKKNAEILDAKNSQLAQAIAGLEEANQTKAKLFGIISHDLRSPISQVYQFLKLQQLNPLLLSDAQRTELSNRIQTATGSLLETMEDLLLWSKTQMNQFKTDIQPTNLLHVTEQCIRLLQLNIEAKNIMVENNVPAEAVLDTDPYYLQTILRNLLQNAIKASGEGSAIRIGFLENNTQRMLTIENSGAAFSQNEYDRIRSQKDSGQALSGLGLKLIDELAEKTGLKVKFENPTDQTTRAVVLF